LLNLCFPSTLNLVSRTAMTVRQNEHVDANGVNTVASVPSLWITGLGSQCPPHLMPPEELEGLAKRWHDAENPG